MVSGSRAQPATVTVDGPPVAASSDADRGALRRRAEPVGEVAPEVAVAVGRAGVARAVARGAAPRRSAGTACSCRGWRWPGSGSDGRRAARGVRVEEDVVHDRPRGGRSASGSARSSANCDARRVDLVEEAVVLGVARGGVRAAVAHRACGTGWRARRRARVTRPCSFWSVTRRTCGLIPHACGDLLDDLRGGLVRGARVATGAPVSGAARGVVSCRKFLRQGVPSVPGTHAAPIVRRGTPGCPRRASSWSRRRSRR